MGRVEELGFAIAALADERNGYLAGVDILCNGGSTTGQKQFKKGRVKPYMNSTRSQKHIVFVSIS